MTACNPRAVLSCIMALLVSVSTLPAQNAPTGGATLSATGNVTINGEAVSDSSALLGNESISTGDTSAAQIISTGTNTLLSAKTVASYLRDSIRLKSGTILITSSNGMSAQVGKLKFSPVNQTALTKYEVQKVRCEVIVIARVNSVSLPDGQILEQGKTARRNDDDCVAAALPVQNGSPGAATLSPRGEVTVDGNAVNSSAALHGNEAISTGDKASAHIASRGSNTVISAKTVASYLRDSIQLKSGTISITSNNGLAAQAGRQKFAPANQAELTKYEVQKLKCRVIVTALVNSVELPDGKILDEGHNRRFSDDDCAAGFYISNGLWALIGAGAAGTAAAATLLLTSGNDSSSGPLSPPAP